jgi:adenylate kinase
MRLILLGAPGSGKGTQAKLLGQRLGLVHVSTGDIFREAVRMATPTGRQAEPYLKNGRLVPDELTNAVVRERFDREDRPERFVMDGYPRTLAQARTFDEILHEQGLDVTVVVLLRVDDEVVVGRMSGRWTCPSCKATYHLISNPPGRPGVCDVCGEALIQRADDREGTVRERLRYYHQNTVEVMPHYQAKGLLRVVDAEGGIEEVYQRIIQALNL